MRASRAIGALKAGWLRTSSTLAAWMSAAGSNRVNTVQRKRASVSMMHAKCSAELAAERKVVVGEVEVEVEESD